MPENKIACCCGLQWHDEQRRMNVVEDKGFIPYNSKRKQCYMYRHGDSGDLPDFDEFKHDFGLDF